MTPPSPALRAASASASATVLALSLVLPAAGPVHADSPEPTGTATSAPGCSEGCTQEPAATGQGEQKPDKTARPDDGTQPDGPAPAQPTAPSTTAPSTTAPSTTAPAAARTAQPAAEGAPGAAGPSHAVEETPGPGATTPTTGAPPSGSNWNVPVTRSPRPTQAAAVSRQGDGPLGPDLPAVAAGLLLVGAGGGAFAWWGRNRLRTH